MYALYGKQTCELLTLNGRPIVHDNRDEMQFLLPNAKVVPVTEADLRARSPLAPIQLRDHPDLTGLRWPLRREDFR